MTEWTPPTRPRAETRREQIVDAASQCARRSGFHGASMAQIAQQAGLSVGQIYRYFQNKESIIAAIAARGLVGMRDKFLELQSSGQPRLEAVLAKCASALDDNYDRQRAALMLEVVAEAARNPGVAAILQAADAEERQMLQQVLKQVAPGNCDAREQLARGEVISMLFKGMCVRSVGNPDADRDAIAKVLRSVVRHLLVEPCKDRTV
jgi:AcrR family transcriptional regulator